MNTKAILVAAAIFTTASAAAFAAADEGNYDIFPVREAVVPATTPAPAPAARSDVSGKAAFNSVKIYDDRVHSY